VIARLLLAKHCRVTVLVLADPSRYQGSALVNYQILQKLDVRQYPAAQSPDSAALIREADVIIDAIFGTGLTRPPEDLSADVIETVNRSGKSVLSVDIPSGVNGDSGQVVGSAIQASWTITFGLPKTGLMLYPGSALAGEIFVSHISFPPALYEASHLQTNINLPVDLPPRRPDGHKGTFGQALFIAGARSYYGAPYFAAMSFLKAGGGYSRLACPRSIAPFIAARAGELVFLPQDETASGALAAKALPGLLDVAEQSDFIVLGPGLSLDEETQTLAADLIPRISKPLIIDGDGLTALSGRLNLLSQRSAPTILTPHPGEMSRLLPENTRDWHDHPVDTARAFSAGWNVCLVLKGAHTLIACPDGEVYINLTGNSGMGTAGSGDVLTGTIAAMFTLGLPVEDAVRMGVLLHGHAGDLAAKKYGEDGMTADDILHALPKAVKHHRAGKLSHFYAQFLRFS
ncbi:MAG: NAD(P)H-hydrate dehydratase, partial [Anaerolineaceae bacterium]